MRFKQKLNFSKGLLFSYLYNKKTPLNVTFALTSRCNSRCIYCKIGRKKEPEMSTSQVLSIIDELAQSGTQRITLYGGEPLLREDIGKIINYSKNKGIFTCISTNGNLFRKKINEIRNVGLAHLSLDGPKKIHDKHRGKGSYQRVIDSIKLANKNNIKVITITVLTKYNINQIDFILDKANELNFKTVFTPLEFFPKKTTDTLDLFASNKQYKKTFQYLLSKKESGAPIASSKSYIKHIINWRDYKVLNCYKNKPNYHCFSGKLFCHIEPNGDVYTCRNAIGRIKPLNCLELGFKEAFNKIGHMHCNSCISPGDAERNLIFSLNFDAIYNSLRTI